MVESNRLVLGTAQFGLLYGVANQSGRVDLAEVIAIVRQARDAGLNSLDTAMSYGNSEQRLGEINVEKWNIITKLPPIPANCADVVAYVRTAISASMGRLKISKLDGLLLHHPEDLLGPHGDLLYRELVALKNEGTVAKIGVSIYSPNELDALWPYFRFDLVQAPFNVMDRRLDSSGWLARLCEAGAEVHVRSVFLQGLLLMSAASRPAAFTRWQPLWDEWDRWLVEHSMTPMQACLGFVLSQPQISRVVVGVDTSKQLQSILASIESPSVIPPAALICEDMDLLNPSRWNLK